MDNNHNSTLNTLYFNESKIVSSQTWMYRNTSGELILHNMHGPAITTFHTTGVIRSQAWLIHDNYHREDGPAIIEYDLDRNIISTSWYLQDRMITPKPYDTWPLTPEQQVVFKLTYS